jgi:hemerythrin-like domain-containing protein
MADVFEVLGADHAEVKSMLSALEDSPGQAAGADERVLAARRAVAEQLIIASSRHEAAEEQYFWPAVRDALGNGNELADTAVAQETAAKELLARIGKAGAADAGLDQLIAEFIPAGRAHIDFEETRVWPSLREALSPARARELGEKIEDAEEHGPTRPHPHTPPSPGLLKTAGPAVAAVDRLRDLVTGRTRS